MDIRRWLGWIAVLSLLSSIALGMSLFTYVLAYDEIFYRMYEVAEDLNTNGILPTEFLTEIEETIEWTQFLPQYLDFFWFASFVAFSITFLVACYRAEREGYLSLFSLLTFGIMLMLFMSGIFMQVSEWFNTVIYDYLLSGISFNTPLFNWYLANYGKYNIILAIVGIILNFVDFDFSKILQRKDKENLSEIN